MHLPRLSSPRFAVVGALLCGAALAGCGSSGTSSSAASSTAGPTSASSSRSAASGASSTSAQSKTTQGVNPNQRETLPPGDIPDTIAYVPFVDRRLGLRISTPEGWSRTTHARRLVFTDKLNRVEVLAGAQSSRATVASVKRTELPALSRSVSSFRLQSITAVQRPAGPAVRIAYLGDSRPDPVTGKVGTLAFERYDFAHNGRECVVLLSSPKGSDNVDPWRIITTSLRFTA